MTSCLFHPNPSVHVVVAIIKSVNLSLKVGAMQKNLPQKSHFKFVTNGFQPVLAQHAKPTMARW